MPRIAIAALHETVNDARRIRVNSAYVDSAVRAGLLPLVVPPLNPRSASEVLDSVDGVLLTGGADLDPALYGETPHPSVESVNRVRDDWEIALVHAAREREMPLLAICRGVQVLNVALGGTLVQDIPSQVQGAIEHDGSKARRRRVHDVELIDGSALAAAMGATHLTVNSLHHQSVGRLADGLAVTGRAPDGVVEGIEAEGSWWMLGVQWHPEELTESPEPWDRGLFEAFARRLRAR